MKAKTALKRRGKRTLYTNFQWIKFLNNFLSYILVDRLFLMTILTNGSWHHLLYETNLATNEKINNFESRMILKENLGIDCSKFHLTSWTIRLMISRHLKHFNFVLYYKGGDSKIFRMVHSQRMTCNSSNKKLFKMCLYP